MAGIEAAEEMTSDQLDAMAGGDLLKNEVNLLKFPYIHIYIHIYYKKFYNYTKNFRLVTLVKYAIQKNHRND